MSIYTRFTVNLPGEESDQLDALIEESDFEPERSGYRGNSDYAQYVRYLIEKEVSDDEE